MKATDLIKNPVIFGTAAGVAVVLINLGIASLAEGSFASGYSVYIANGAFAYLIPLSVAVQMGLFRHHRNTAPGKLCGADKVGISGSFTAGASMVLCCLHHVTDILPSIGFLLATVNFLTNYKDALMAAGLAANILGSLMLIRMIRGRGTAASGSAA